jgi:thioredoxin-related protein
MKRALWLLMATLATLSPQICSAAGRELNWREWDEGLREAAASRRPVLVDVYTDWCGWCKRMDRDVYSQDAIRDYLSQRYVIIKLNAESKDTERYEGRSFTSRSLAARFRVTGYPTTLFLRPNGEHLVNVPGYVPPPRFLLLLRYIGDGYLDRGVPFDEFVKKVSDPGKN